jgi:hypothetical protein
MMTQPGLECPQCGKHSLVQRTSDVYVCLNCNFKKDFAAPPAKQSNFSLLPFIGIATLFLLAHLLRQLPEPINTSAQPSRSIPQTVSTTPK